MKALWIIVALINFMIASVLGVIMRYAFVGDLHDFSYRNIMHAHSHLAMMGWIFMILFIVIIYNFIPESQINKAIYKNLFWANQMVVTAMTISFLMQGYSLISIILSTLHIFISYVFTYRIWQDIHHLKTDASLLVRTALVWMILSTLGVWMLGPVMLIAGKASALYFMCIQFFLHFQFNGWFLFAVLAIFFEWLRLQKVPYSPVHFNWFYGLLVISCLMTYMLAVTWSTPEKVLFFINGLGVILQLVALYFFIAILRWIPVKYFAEKNLFSRWFLVLALASFIFKILIQSAVVIPQIAIISYTIRQFVIGFIHLTLLGAITGYLISYLIDKGIIITTSIVATAGLTLLLFAFFSTEILLFAQGLLLWTEQGYFSAYYQWMLILSTLFPTAIVLIIIAIKTNNALIKSKLILNIN